MFVGETVIDGVVAPVDQVSEPVQLAVNVTFSPAQMPSLVAVIVGVAPVPTVTVTAAEALLEHSPILQKAEYVPVIDGANVMLEPVEAFDQTTVPVHPFAVNVTDWPAQILLLLAAIVGGVVGIPIVTVITFDLLLTQFNLVQVAV